MQNEESFLLEYLGHHRIFGVCNGMKKDELFRKYKPDQQPDSTTFLYPENETQVFFCKEGRINSVALYLSSEDSTFFLFNKKIKRKNIYNISEFIEFFLKERIEFHYIARIGDEDGSRSLYTSYGDQYYFEKRNDKLLLSVITLMFI